MLPLLLCASMGCINEKTPSFKEVNPFIGTGGHGHTYPGATAPFGMVQLSPDTRLTGWDGCGGYHYSDSMIYGFSHTHLQGTGVSDYGDILFMPTTKFHSADRWADRYKSKFSHDNESAHAGYYSVFLEDHGILAELTTTERVGIHRYSLATPDTVVLIVDMQHRDALTHYSIYPLDDTTLVGHRVSDNWAREQHVYFVARFDQPFIWQDQLAEYETIGTNEINQLEQTLTYTPVFACDFGVLNELNVRVGLSFVSIDGAMENLVQEAPTHGFDGYREAAERRWEDQLASIEIQGGSMDERTIFYTALYHSFTVPNVANDVNGAYRGTDMNIHQLPEGETHYTVFSLWDTFRALHPLLNWIEPVRSLDFIKSMLRMYSDGGQLPVWELAANYTGCMIGYHSVPVIQDAVTWGVEDFDHDLALEAMIQAADSAHLGLPAYQTLGYIPLDLEHESVSKTLEYAYDDACIGRFATYVGQLKDLDGNVGISSEALELSERFRLRALNYRNLFNPESGFVQAKRAGAWLEDFDPREVNFNFTEANGWQYNFFMPHDINGHIALIGGDEAYADKLDELFQSSSETTGREQADITGLIGQYAHGNEPSHHVAYLYPYVGQHQKTAELVKKIREELYFNAPDGLSGNEDCGQMSAWLVWSAIGMYPVSPGSSQLVLGSPQFDEIIITPRKGHVSKANSSPSVRIQAKGKGPFITSVTHDRQLSSRQSFVEKTSLLQGGIWEFERSNNGGEFGVEVQNRPQELWNDSAFVSVPIISAPRTFREESVIELKNSNGTKPEGHIEFRLSELNDERQESGWTTYAAPIPINRSVVIQARNSDQAGHSSKVVSHVIRKIDHEYELNLGVAFNPQYAAGGSQALIDGIRGGAQFQTGDWQGFWGEDVHGQIDFKTIQTVTGVSIGALRDIRPWIFLPKSISLEYSTDGATWSSYGAATHDHSDAEESPLVHRFQINRNVQARFMRFKVKNYGTLPAGHLGAGNPSWVFLDEIEVLTQR